MADDKLRTSVSTVSCISEHINNARISSLYFLRVLSSRIQKQYVEKQKPKTNSFEGFFHNKACLISEHGKFVKSDLSH